MKHDDLMMILSLFPLVSAVIVTALLDWIGVI